MERITSRKNARLRHFRQLGRERAYRTETGEFLCDGDKLLTEALQNGAEVTAVLYRESRPGRAVPACRRQEPQPIRRRTSCLTMPRPL